MNSSAAYILIYRLKNDIEKLDYFNIINSISEALNNEILLNNMIKSDKICLSNFYSNGEPVNTRYGRGYIIEGNIDNPYNHILKVKLKSGIGYLK